MLEKQDVQQQSINAWNAWRTKWLHNCRINRDVPHLPVAPLVNRGKGKVCVQAAFGYSLSRHLDIIKEYRRYIDVYCCDKAFGYLVENGIIPDYCQIADASVEPHWIREQDTSRTTLIANVSANPEWTQNWKGPLVFYVNWDNIGTAQILARAADIWETIPASSNVSNAQVVFASQVLNYDYQLLTGYDYSWQDGGTYYAGQDSPKRFYMYHADMVSPFGYIARCSSNLVFSCQWLAQFFMKFQQVRAINCSERGILDITHKMPLEVAIRRYALSHRGEGDRLLQRQIPAFLSLQTAIKEI